MRFIPEILIPSNCILELTFQCFLTYLVIIVVRSIYNCFLRPAKDLLKRYGTDSYVLITGATDGIGKGYAVAFAKKGFNLILVSRTESKLKSVQEEILKLTNNKIKVDYLPYNFSKQTSLQDYESAFLPLINNKDISVLVNNVGISHEDYFYKLSNNAEIYDYINVNVTSQTVLTKLLMDKLSKRKNKSAIISMSSLAAVLPYPGNAIYSASKAYNDFLSRALFGEYGYESGNIDFLSVKPSYVESNMSQMKPDGFDCIRVDQHVNSVLGELGYTDETIGYFTHKLQAYILLLLPVWVQRYMFKISKEKEEKLQVRHQNNNKKTV